MSANYSNFEHIVYIIKAVYLAIEIEMVFVNTEKVRDLVRKLVYYKYMQ